MSDTKVTIARKSYDHLLRTRDRAISDAKWQREQVEHAHRWAQEAFVEQRRLADRLDRAALRIDGNAEQRRVEEADRG